MTSIKYKIIPFRLDGDNILHKYSRRCVRPRYDGPGDVYPVAPMNTIPIIHDTFYPTNTRVVSPLARSYRAPNLPEHEWICAEEILEREWRKPGIIIQIFSTITAINIKTIYLLEQTIHPFKRWKRIIHSYHLSEPRLYNPHVVDEIDIQ